jgi:catechol 2,3-dioxygenase-like lactoylglutathione lyase family enzyme
VIADRAPQLRIARPSRDLEAATRFYTSVLGFAVLATFEDHAGFDGVILGHADWPYHLEFTRRPADPIEPRSSEEDLLVLYLPDHDRWSAVVRQLRALDVPRVSSSNPYWDEHGITIADPDGYRLVLANSAWP